MIKEIAVTSLFLAKVIWDNVCLVLSIITVHFFIHYYKTFYRVFKFLGIVFNITESEVRVKWAA